MLYDSTKSLLQGILRSLETVDDTGWDDQTESGTACLYEMHQMSGSMHTPYKPDKLNAASQSPGNLAEKLTRAIPHVRTMVIAIRHKDRATALESGKAGLAELNAVSSPVTAGGRKESAMESKRAAVARPPEKPAPKARAAVASRQALASSQM